MTMSAKPALLTRRLSLRLSFTIGAMSLLATALFAAFLMVTENRALEYQADSTFGLPDGIT